MTDATPPQRRRLVVGGVVALVLTLALGALTAVGATRALDEGWMALMATWRGPVGEAIARVFDFVGGGWFAIFAVPIGAAVAFVLVRRPWHALAFLLVSALSAGVCQLLKPAFGRARPDDILLTLSNGSYPSGHTTNAAVIAVTLALIARRAWVWALAALYIVAMAFSRTYLGAHWVSDTVGGALLGAGVALLVGALMLPQLRREQRPGQQRIRT